MKCWTMAFAMAIMAGFLAVIEAPVAAVFPSLISIGWFLRSAALAVKENDPPK